MLEGEIGICVRTFKTKLGDSLFLSKRCFLMEDLYITLYVNYVSVMYARVKKKERLFWKLSFINVSYFNPGRNIGFEIF